MFNDNQTAHKKVMLCSNGINVLNKYSTALVSNIQFFETMIYDEENFLLRVAKPSARWCHQKPCAVWTNPNIFACMNMGVSHRKTARNKNKVLHNGKNVWKN